MRAEYAVFLAELTEFFNATTLDKRLSQARMALARPFLPRSPPAGSTVACAALPSAARGRTAQPSIGPACEVRACGRARIRVRAQLIEMFGDSAAALVPLQRAKAGGTNTVAILFARAEAAVPNANWCGMGGVRACAALLLLGVPRHTHKHTHTAPPPHTTTTGCSLLLGDSLHTIRYALCDGREALRLRLWTLVNVRALARAPQHSTAATCNDLPYPACVHAARCVASR
jgi:hypothetical protein